MHAEPSPPSTLPPPHQAQTDLRAEAANMRRIAINFRKWRDVAVPAAVLATQVHLRPVSPKYLQLPRYSPCAARNFRKWRDVAVPSAVLATQVLDPFHPEIPL